MNIYRKKLLNAILFYSKNTEKLGTVKLCKLLFYLDFFHFEETGYPSIGLEYYAWDFGPLPLRFWEEIRGGKVPEDFRGKLLIRAERAGEDGEGPEGLRFTAKTEADLSAFTPREVRIMEELAFIYKDADGKTMTEASHGHGEPWAITKREKGLESKIDYMTALSAKPKRWEKTAAKKAPEATSKRQEAFRASLNEFFAFLNTFNVKPTK